MKYVIPILIGLGAAFAAAAVFFPVMYLVFDNFFDLYVFSKPPPNDWVNDMVIFITAGVWVLITGGAGGFVAAKYAEQKEDFVIFLFIISSYIIAFLVSRGGMWAVEALLPIGLYAAGSIAGAIISVRRKQKREREKQTES